MTVKNKLHRKNQKEYHSDIKVLYPSKEIDFSNLGPATLVGNKLQFDLSGQIDEIIKNSPKPPKIKFTRRAMDKTRALVREYDKELAWHGIVTRNKEENTLTVTDIIMYPQLTSAVTVDADEEEYPMWVAQLEDEQFENLRMQGHSHVNMGVTPSGVDEDYYKELIAQFDDYYYLIMIINKRDQITLRYYDIEANRQYDNLETEWNLPFTGWAKDEMNKNIIKGPVITVDRFKTLNRTSHTGVINDDIDSLYEDYGGYYGYK